MRFIFSCMLAVSLLCAPSGSHDGVEIALKKGSQSEVRTRERLEKLLQRYDLSKWTFTRKVLIEDGVIPHSHPVLTLNTREDLEVLLATYVHEQTHWHLSTNHQRTEKAKAELKAMYPKVPVGSPDGARNEESTYLHLIVIYLEYVAMRELVGEMKAKEVFEGKRYYRWIYKTILADLDRIREVVERYQLQI